MTTEKTGYEESLYVARLVEETLSKIVPKDYYSINFHELDAASVQSSAMEIFQSQIEDHHQRAALLELVNQFKFAHGQTITVNYRAPFAENSPAVERADKLMLFIENNGRTWLFSYHNDAAILSEDLFAKIKKFADEDKLNPTDLLAEYLFTTQHHNTFANPNQYVEKVKQLAAKFNFPLDLEKLSLRAERAGRNSKIHCYAAGLPNSSDLPLQLHDIICNFFHLETAPPLYFNGKKPTLPIDFESLKRQVFWNAAPMTAMPTPMPSLYEVCISWIDLHKKEPELYGYLYPNEDILKLTPEQISELIVIHWLSTNDFFYRKSKVGIVGVLLEKEKRETRYGMGLNGEGDEDLKQLIKILERVAEV